MRSGDLDRTVTLQVNTPVQDGTGAPVDAWTNVVDLAAKVTPTPGREMFAGQVVTATRFRTFRIRYRTGITARHRFLYDGLAWDILDVREIGRREALEIDAKAITGT